jgi:hypothetical protein
MHNEGILGISFPSFTIFNERSSAYPFGITIQVLTEFERSMSFACYFTLGAGATALGG